MSPKTISSQSETDWQRLDSMTDQEIVEALPDLVPADIEQSLRYAAEAVRERELPLATS